MYPLQRLPTDVRVCNSFPEDVIASQVQLCHLKLILIPQVTLKMTLWRHRCHVKDQLGWWEPLSTTHGGTSMPAEDPLKYPSLSPRETTDPPRMTISIAHCHAIHNNNDVTSWRHSGVIATGPMTIILRWLRTCLEWPEGLWIGSSFGRATPQVMTYNDWAIPGIPLVEATVCWFLT